MNGVKLNSPSFLQFGDTYQFKLDDSVCHSENSEEIINKIAEDLIFDIYNYKADKWIEEVVSKRFRTERETGNKFILPLLPRLGFEDNDRYDGMIINAAHGSKQTTLEVDFALFNSENENIESQILLVVEAKKEARLYKKVELDKALKQIKSYVVW